MFRTIKREVNYNSGLTRQFKILSALVLPIALSACGGGGGSTQPGGGTGSGNGNSGGTGGSAPYNQRVVEEVLDYDNNGQMDARFDYVYFADGRLNMVTYTYIGDGTPDIYNPYYTALITQADSELSYDNNGKLAGFKITLNNGASINDVTYTYNGNQFVQADATVTSSTGSTSMLTGKMSYTNGLASQYNLSNAGNVILNYQFSHNANNQVIQSVKANSTGGNPETSTYQWNPDGSLSKITKVDSLSTNVEDLIYAGGLLQQRDFTFSRPPTNPKNTNVSWIFTYNRGAPLRTDFDLNMDGSIDATATIKVETGPCTPVYLNMPEDISGTGGDGKPGSAFGLTWCG